MAVPMSNRKKKEIFRAIDVVLRKYNGVDLRIKHIECDGEFRAMFDEVKDELGVVMNYATAFEHVTPAERNIRTVKERCRCGYHYTHFTYYPRAMTRGLVILSTDQLNYFPPKGGVSEWLSPYAILNRKNLDYNKHLQYHFGCYVQVNQENDPTNTMAPRTIDAIYLRPDDNEQGGHIVMAIPSGDEIRRRRVWPAKMTNTIIEAVHAIAFREGVKTQFKFQTKREYDLFPGDQLEGVDYEEGANVIDEREDFEPDEANEDDDANEMAKLQAVDQDEVEALEEAAPKEWNLKLPQRKSMTTKSENKCAI
jgi:hypothetical protein